MFTNSKCFLLRIESNTRIQIPLHRWIKTCLSVFKECVGANGGRIASPQISQSVLTFTSLSRNFSLSCWCFGNYFFFTHNSRNSLRKNMMFY